MCYNAIKQKNKEVNVIKTAIIDNSLISADFSEDATPEFLKDYVISLFKCGVDYIETDFSSVKLLNKVNTGEHFILRIERPADIAILNSKSYAYTVLPLNLIFLAPSILNTQIILEVSVNTTSLTSILERLSNNYALKYVSMLRIVGDFSEKTEELTHFIADFKRSFVLPLDICPLNTSLCGLETAFTAYKNKADAITLSFGENAVFTSLEKFIIYLQVYYGVVIEPEYVKGMCAAALDFSVLTNSVGRGVKNLSDIITVQTGRVINIDFPNSRKTTVKIKHAESEISEAHKNDFRKEIKDELLKIISENNIQLANFEELKDAVKKTQTNLI